MTQEVDCRSVSVFVPKVHLLALKYSLLLPSLFSSRKHLENFRVGPLKQWSPTPRTWVNWYWAPQKAYRILYLLSDSEGLISFKF